ncbi:Cation/H(+) antiporter 4 [Spatholobus suberectus]|nr:Cation/H(+) antiporter 4 [Spatholobus suberectus]
MMLFPYGSQDTLATIASLGYVLFVFENGVKMDYSMITRAGKKGWVISLVGLALPLLIGSTHLQNLSAFLTQGVDDKDHSAIVILMTQNMNSFAVIASILNDLQILNSELGRLTLSCALVGDMLSNILVISTAVFDNESSTQMIAYTSSLYFKLPLKDAVSLALLLNCKGVMEISMISICRDYTVILTIIMMTSSIVHLLVKRLYDPSRKYIGYQKRDIFSLKPNSGLRILVCIHKQHHTIPITRALDLCNPRLEDPSNVDVLHLIELVGRSSPIFISHRMKKGVPSRMRNSYSEDIILSFKLCEDEKQGATSINPYTAISPPTLMHEDVCYLALDRVASIIILPFHRKWSIDGKIEHEDKTIRSLNCKVMEKAPCSVGILVSRFVHQRDSPLRLAMIFLGGNDDREALCLANRAAKDSSVNLVVYHITTNNNKNDIQDIDTMLDLAMLKEAKKEYSSSKNVIRKEIVVEGGPQIASVLRQMVDEHDFFL